MGKIAIGTVQFGLDYGVNNVTGQVQQAEVEKILTVLQTHSINILDTASAYGQAEKILGKNKIDHFDIVTKVSNISTEENLQTAIEQSIRNLKQNKIYGCLFHSFADYKNNPKVLDYISKYKTKGLIEKVGFSLYSPNELDILLNANANFDLIQVPYSIFDQRFEPYFPELKKRKVEIHTRSTFLQGLFFMEPDNMPSFFTPIRSMLIELHKIAQTNNLTIEKLALSFVLLNPFVDYSVIGIDSVGQLHRNLDALLKLDELKKTYASLKGFKVNNEQILNPSNWKN